MSTVHANPNLLLATDLDGAFRPHAVFAGRLADALGARLHLFHAILPQPIAAHDAPLLATQPRMTPDTVVEQGLHELADAVRVSRPPAVRFVTDARPVHAILAAAADVHADLVLLPSHARAGISRLLLGSVAEQVLRQSTIPVVLINDAMAAAKTLAAGETKPILFATDFSDTATTALPTAIGLARRLRRPLMLMTAVSPIVPATTGGGAPVAHAADESRQLVADAENRLRQLAGSVPSDLAADIQVVIERDAAAAIRNAARNLGAALVVMATHGRSGPSRWIMGSVAETVVRHCTVPVVCVPAKS